MDFNDVVRKRYAAKRFDGKTLSQQQIDQLIALILLAPTSYNLQPYKVIVVGERALKERLSAAAHHQPQVTTCSHLFVFCANTDITGNIALMQSTMQERNVPAEKVASFVHVLRNFEQQIGDEARSWAQRQTFLPLGNALNGATALGFDSCPMEGFDPDEFSRVLALPANLIPTALCAVGYATDTPRPKLRFARDDLFIMADTAS